MTTSTQTEISNPILRGFNPDPSIVRVGDDYYIATSTFEWYPGVQIHHSKDLVNWRLVARPLNRPDLLDMAGNPCSCGVWAPCLSYDNGLFYLIYTDVKRFDGNKDTPNYLTTCATIDGDWSEPIYLNSSGFDPSLFHDDDGRKWLANMVWDYRPNRNLFGGILLQEYSVKEQKLVGPVTNIFKGTDHGLTEAPHIYKRAGYYYLVTAEGGTEYEHAMTMARSQSLTGPYEVDPIKHFVTSKDNPELYIQRSGHGDIVETQNGETYIVHLCGRPLDGEDRRCPLGRETAIQEGYWNEDGWLRLRNETGLPAATVKRPTLPLHPWPAPVARTEFNDARLPIDFQWLRTPHAEQLFSLTANPGYLRLFGRDSLGSLYYQALVARRQQAFSFRAETKVLFSPTSFLHKAGLVSYYNSQKYHYCYITVSDQGNRQLAIMSCEGDVLQERTYPLFALKLQGRVNEEGCITIPNTGAVYLRADVSECALDFSWSMDGVQWNNIPVTLDQSLVSDQAGGGAGRSFTGAFIGMACQDLTGTLNHADFEYFDYVEFEDRHHGRLRELS